MTGRQIKPFILPNASLFSSLSGLVSPKLKYLNLVSLEESNGEVSEVNNGERIVFSAFDVIQGKNGEYLEVLLIARKNSITIWKRGIGIEPMKLILNISDVYSVLDSEQRTLAGDEIGEIIGLVVINTKEAAPLLAIFTTKINSNLLLYSLQSHCVTHIQQLEGIGTQLVTKGPVIVISALNPPLLHILDSQTFLPLPFSPIIDISSSSSSSSDPVFDLAPSGRFLAYVSNSPIPSQHSRSGKPPLGEGILAGPGFFVETTTGVGVEKVKIVSDIMINSMEYLITKTRSSLAMVTDEVAVGVNAGNELLKKEPSGISKGFVRWTSIGYTPSHNNLFKDQTVMIIDLESPTMDSTTSPRSSIAHFRPSSPTTFLSFSPSGSSILTSSTGQTFDIFEIRPKNSISSSGEVWHRYRLVRGVTFAETKSVDWSRDGRFISIISGSGTAHIFAIHPSFGKPDLERHFHVKVANLEQPATLSITLHSVARIQSPIDATPGHQSPIINFEHALKDYRDLLLFYPDSSKVVLHRLTLSVSPSPVQIAAETMSGLSTMMKNRGSTGIKNVAEFAVIDSAKVEWNLERVVDELEVKDILESSNTEVEKKNNGPDSAQVEIETFSRFNSKSIYLSTQFEFHHLEKSVEVDSNVIRLGKKIEVRPFVRVGENLMDSSLFTALQTVPLPTSPPSLPNYPNGFGKTGSSWRESISHLNLPAIGPPVRKGLEQIKIGYNNVSSSFESASISFEEDIFTEEGSLESRFTSDEAHSTQEEDTEGIDGWGLEEEVQFNEEEFEFDEDFGDKLSTGFNNSTSDLIGDDDLMKNTLTQGKLLELEGKGKGNVEKKKMKRN